MKMVVSAVGLEGPTPMSVSVGPGFGAMLLPFVCLCRVKPDNRLRTAKNLAELWGTEEEIVNRAGLDHSHGDIGFLLSCEWTQTGWPWGAFAGARQSATDIRSRICNAIATFLLVAKFAHWSSKSRTIHHTKFGNSSPIASVIHDFSRRLVMRSMAHLWVATAEQQEKAVPSSRVTTDPSTPTEGGVGSLCRSDTYVQTFIVHPRISHPERVV